MNVNVKAECKSRNVKIIYFFKALINLHVKKVYYLSCKIIVLILILTVNKVVKLDIILHRKSFFSHTKMSQHAYCFLWLYF